MALQDDNASRESGEEMNIFRAPAVRYSGGVLNRALFSKKIDLAAATVRDAKNISKYRKALEKSNEALRADRISAVAPDPDKDLAAKGRKCLLLAPGIKAGGASLIRVGVWVLHLVNRSTRLGNLGTGSEGWGPEGGARGYPL